jgi:predicted metal-dependent peptidase
MHDNDKHAALAIAKARAELIQSQTFYGVLVSQVEPKPTRQFPTMATNGKTHFYNPDFIAGLTQKQVLGVQHHESEHDARRHHTRRGDRDPQEWNICTDYAINIDLVDAGVELPPGALIDPKYRGWSAEEIYRARELDRRQQQQQPQPQPQQEQDDSQDADDQEAANNEADSSEDSDERDSGDDGDSNEAGDEGQETGDDGDGGAANDGGADDESDAEPNDGAGGEGEGDETDGDGQGDAPGKGDADGDAEGEGQGQSDGQGDATNGKGEPQSSGDPGMCGEVLDADVDEPSDLAAEDAKWETVLRQAASLAAKRGNAPGHVAREIKRADSPPQDWRETLRAWFDQGATRRETWAKPNRRFIGGGLYLPGSERDGINRVAFLIDTSGSMDDIALACIGKETQAALDEGIIDEAVVIYGDTRVTRVDVWHNGDEMVFDPKGGGGTMLRPLFDHVEQLDDVSLIVCFSDMEFEDLNATPAPACPVLFAATGYPDKVKRYLAQTPWNSPGIDVGSH